MKVCCVRQQQVGFEVSVRGGITRPIICINKKSRKINRPNRFLRTHAVSESDTMYPGVYGPWKVEPQDVVEVKLQPFFSFTLPSSINTSRGGNY